MVDTFSFIDPSKNLEQANHNHNLAERLFKAKKKAFDWVCTISYYAAIHYFEYFLKINNPTVRYKGKEASVSSLQDLKREFGHRLSKHNLRSEIIQYNFKEIDEFWDNLKDISYNSRYNCYVVIKEEAEESLQSLKGVKEWLLSQVKS